MATIPMTTVGVRLPIDVVERLRRVARVQSDRAVVPVPVPPSTLARGLLLQELARVERELGIGSSTFSEEGDDGEIHDTSTSSVMDESGQDGAA